jgi:membrane protein YqaA with SNARE-associated domain
VQQYDFAANVWLALVMLVIFASLGAAIGGLTDWILGDTLRYELASQMSAAPKRNEPQAQPPNTF